MNIVDWSTIPVLNEMCGIGLEWLALMTVKTSIVLAIAWVVAASVDLRLAAARTRRMWWAVTIVLALALPMLGIALSQGQTNSAGKLVTVGDISSGLFSVDDEEGASESHNLNDVVTADFVMMGDSGLFLNGYSVVVSIWLAGFMVVLSRWIIGCARLHLLSRRSSISSNEWNEAVRSVADVLRLRRLPRICFSDRTESPATWGVWSPCIVLPYDAINWSAERKRVVLLHELTHIKRLDWLLLAVSRLFCAVYWFNPLVWTADKRLRTERELACDERVLQCGVRPSAYASHLVQIARDLTSNRILMRPAIMMGAEGTLDSRIKKILNGPSSHCSPFVFVPLIIGLLVFVSGLSAVTTNRLRDVAGLSPGTTLTVDEQMENGRFAMQSGQWSEGVEAFESVVDAQPQNAEAWFRLGYVLHMSGQFEESRLASSECASLASRWRALALYNNACSLARMNRLDDALRALGDALRAGFDDHALIMNDRDLVVLRSHPKFPEQVSRSIR